MLPVRQFNAGGGCYISPRFNEGPVRWVDMRQWLSRLIGSFRRRTADDVVPEPLSDWEYDERTRSPR